MLLIRSTDSKEFAGSARTNGLRAARHMKTGRPALAFDVPLTGGFYIATPVVKSSTCVTPSVSGLVPSSGRAALCATNRVDAACASPLLSGSN